MEYFYCSTRGRESLSGLGGLRLGRRRFFQVRRMVARDSRGKRLARATAVTCTLRTDVARGEDDPLLVHYRCNDA